jgi:N-acylglucosamine 2-epimerase
MNMDTDRLNRLMQTHESGLLDDILPFWIHYSVDREHGGFIFNLDRDGTVVDTDKPMWIEGRFTWLLATLYSNVEKRGQWLDLAKHGIDFILEHGFDNDGRMFYSVTREGAPLRQRRYLFSECFATFALAAYGGASGDEAIVRRAEELLQLILRYSSEPGLLEPKIDAQTRPARGLGLPMILINTAQVLRESKKSTAMATQNPQHSSGSVDCSKLINEKIDEIDRYLVNREYRCVFETAGPNGELIDHFEGRLLTPGHGIEAAWFILHESRLRGGDNRLTKLGCTMLDWMWEIGWDREYGGIIYFKDARGLPVTEYWHDMKFWWPQNEAIIATLLAYYLTREEKYLKWHILAHDWAHEHFPDVEYGEWFGYLHRDGRRSSPLKGNMFKGPFHIPRMQLYCWKLLEEMIQG